MASQHIVVDGSNIATEGRSTPSLAQLEEAVRELRKEFPDAEVTVVVDATFAHRIDPSELPRFEAALSRGEYVSPPAGAIGRGDAFLLRIAERVDATVLSNDSFQEFHGEHAWLFERGRLIGATPVPGIGWIFVPRTPVRGPTSRISVRETQRERARVEKAVAAATAEAVEPTPEPRASSAPSRRAKGVLAKPQAVNDPLTFISFIAAHHLGDELEATVESFSSHGAVVRIGDVRCYVPLSGLGDPPPKSAREVLRRGEVRKFVLIALDPHRRGVELALPGLSEVSGRPSEETVAAELEMTRRPAAKRVAKTSAAKVPAAKGPAPRPRKARAATKDSTLAKTPARSTTALQDGDGKAGSGKDGDAKTAAPARRSRRATTKEASTSPLGTRAAKVTPPEAPGDTSSTDDTKGRVRTLFRRAGRKES